MKQIILKRRILLSTIILFSGLLLTITFWTILNLALESTEALLFFLIIIIGFCVLVYLKTRLDRLTLSYQYHRLFYGRQKPYRIARNPLTEDQVRKLENSNFILYERFNNHSLYYRLTYHQAKKDKGRTLEIILLIYDDKLKFEDVRFVRHINSLEESLRKKEKYRHRIIIQFKSEKQQTNDILESSHSVLWLKKRIFHITLINVLYFVDTKSLYFVHNSDYAPTYQYQYAVDLIKQLTNS